jgi:hypothetical protein
MYIIKIKIKAVDHSDLDILKILCNHHACISEFIYWLAQIVTTQFFILRRKHFQMAQYLLFMCFFLNHAQRL